MHSYLYDYMQEFPLLQQNSYIPLILKLWSDSVVTGPSQTCSCQEREFWPHGNFSFTHLWESFPNIWIACQKEWQNTLPVCKGKIQVFHIMRVQMLLMEKVASNKRKKNPKPIPIIQVHSTVSWKLESTLNVLKYHHTCKRSHLGSYSAFLKYPTIALFPPCLFCFLLKLCCYSSFWNCSAKLMSNVDLCMF